MSRCWSPIAAGAVGLLALCSGPARASLTRAELAGVEAAPAAGATIPMQLAFQDLSGRTVDLGTVLGGRPTLLVLADYDCHELCGPILSVVARTLSRTGLQAGRDFGLLVVGLNPRASLADAAAMKTAQLDGFPDVARAARLLTGTPEAVGSLERALAYRAVYDSESGRFAHPSDVFVLTERGAVSRVLPGLGLDPSGLRLALVEAGQGRIGTFADRLHLFCYGLDPAIGKATRPVRIVMIGGGLITLGGLAMFVARARPRNGLIREGGSA